MGEICQEVITLKYASIIVDIDLPGPSISRTEDEVKN